MEPYYAGLSVRSIDPAAQNFRQAFDLGDTDSNGINTVIIDGANLATVKAREKRTVGLRESVA